MDNALKIVEIEHIINIEKLMVQIKNIKYVQTVKHVT